MYVIIPKSLWSYWQPCFVPPLPSKEWTWLGYHISFFLWTMFSSSSPCISTKYLCSLPSFQDLFPSSSERKSKVINLTLDCNHLQCLQAPQINCFMWCHSSLRVATGILFCTKNCATWAISKQRWITKSIALFSIPPFLVVPYFLLVVSNHSTTFLPSLPLIRHFPSTFSNPSHGFSLTSIPQFPQTYSIPTNPYK